MNNKPKYNRRVLTVVTGSPPRVAFYIPSFERGGVERFLINICGELIDLGIDVDILVNTTDPPAEQLDSRVRLVQMGSKSLAGMLSRSLLPSHVAKGVVSFPAYIRYLIREKPDLLVSLQINPFAIMGTMLVPIEIPVVIRESNTPSVASVESEHPVSQLAPSMKRLFYPRAERIVAVSRDVAADIADFVGVSQEMIDVVYNPTYTDSVLEKAMEPVDHPWFYSDVPVISSVGRFADQKDFETLLRAFARVRRTRDLRLILVGDGDNRSTLESLSATLGVEDDVAFLGYQENPYKFMARSELFVLSSYYEGLPNVLIEALAVGTPVVASDCPSGPREILVDGDGGKLVPVNDVDAMASAITSALDNSSKTLNKLAIASRNLERFRPERAAEEYGKLIQELNNR